MAFVAAHIPLALILSRLQPLATLHAWGTLGLGLYWAFNRENTKVMWAAAYIIGAEVFWRATGAAVNWEFGKYSISLLFVVAILRSRQGSPPATAFLYFALLLPAAVMTFFMFPFDYARPRVSFNMSGPLALFLSVWFFARCIRMDKHAFVRVGLVWVAVTLAIATLGAQAISAATAEGFEFTAKSNDVGGGWTGANQSSAILGLGAVASVFVLALGQLSRASKAIIVVSLGLLVIQNTLTFSRTGLVLTVMGSLAFVVFLLRESRYRLAIVAASVILVSALQFAVIPTLDEFTGGAFTERFTDADLTGRDDIMLVDLQIWSDHVFFGVGAGVGQNTRQKYGYRDANAHTEYTRMLAEHGMLGFLAIVALFVLCAQPVLRSRTPEETGVKLALVMWAAAFMVVSAFRLSVPAFLIGLCWAQFAFVPSPNSVLERGRQYVQRTLGSPRRYGRPYGSSGLTS